MATGIARYIGRRVLMLIPVVLGILAITFVLTRVVPGDPAGMLLGTHASPEAEAQMRQLMGLDRPIWEQFIIYVGEVLHGELGWAWHTGNPVAVDLAARFPATFELTTLAVLLATIVGIPLGVASAVYRNRLPDHLSRIFALLGVATPSFWLGLMAIYLLYFRWHAVPAPMGQLDLDFVPPSGPTHIYLIDTLWRGDWAAFRNAAEHLILPVLTLAYGTMALVTRMVRSSMLEVLLEDYIRTARAKGLGERAVIYVHALRNAVIPTVTVLGLAYGQLLGGTVLIETVFSWPGVGSYMVESISALDYAPIEAVAMLLTVIYVLVNLLVDVAYAFLDVRIKYY